MRGSYVERAAPADLAGEVACTWTMQTAGAMTLVPDGCLDLLWIEGGRFVVCGPETSGWSSVLPPGLAAAGIRFRPGVAPAALGVPAVTLRDARVPADELWGSSARHLAEQMAEAPGSAARVALLTAEVRRRLAAGPPVDPVAREIAARLTAPQRAGVGDGAGDVVGDGVGDGGVGVARLAADLGYSERQLHRRSTAAFGYGPAVLARILRLQRFIALGRSGGRWAGRARVGREQGVAGLAAAAGYADGPHLARECRAIAGTTPSALVGRGGDASDPYTTLSHLEFTVTAPPR